MKEQIAQSIETALTELKKTNFLSESIESHIQIERCREESHGHFACNIALILAKPAKKPPRDIAQAIVEHLPPHPLIQKVEIAGPGFINFFLADAALTSIVSKVLKAGDHYGQSNQYHGKRIHMEFVSANPTGPLHVGHGRGAAYGACVANLLKTVGYAVHCEYYVNDAGRQMRILALSTWLRYLELLGEAIDLPPNAYQGDYIIAIAKTIKEDVHQQYLLSFSKIKSLLPEPYTEETKETYIDSMVAAMQALIGKDAFHFFSHHTLETILSDIKEDLEEFGVVYDNWFHESQLFKTDLLEKGIQLLKSHQHIYEKAGATWFRATDFGDEKDRVLLRANGQPTYFASDVAYHLYKYAQGYDHIIDIFGADHHGYIDRINAFLKSLDKNPKKLETLLVQFAILYRGTEKVSMSTRSGEYVTLRELRQEVGNDAARYFYIMRKPEQHLDFDLKLAKEQSNENPVYYIQYAHARICSVWKQLEKNAKQWDNNLGLQHISKLTENIEKTLLQQLAQYPEVIHNAALHREPHVLASFLQSLANSFHSYYNSHKFIIDEADLRNARLCLIAAVQQVLKNGLLLLGLSAPKSM